MSTESNDPVVISDAQWTPGSYIQSLSRLKRRPGPNDSRNKREGHYNFKVKGKHTRKRRSLKIVILGN